MILSYFDTLAPPILLFFEDTEDTDVQSRSTAEEPSSIHENLVLSLLVFVWIVVSFSTNILSTDQTCFLSMITDFLFEG